MESKLNCNYLNNQLTFLQFFKINLFYSTSRLYFNRKLCPFNRISTIIHKKRALFTFCNFHCFPELALAITHFFHHPEQMLSKVGLPTSVKKYIFTFSVNPVKFIV